MVQQVNQTNPAREGYLDQDNQLTLAKLCESLEEGNVEVLNNLDLDQMFDYQGTQTKLSQFLVSYFTNVDWQYGKEVIQAILAKNPNLQGDDFYDSMIEMRKAIASGEYPISGGEVMLARLDLIIQYMDRQA